MTRDIKLNQIPDPNALKDPVLRQILGAMKDTHDLREGRLRATGERFVRYKDLQAYGLLSSSGIASAAASGGVSQVIVDDLYASVDLPRYAVVATNGSGHLELAGNTTAAHAIATLGILNASAAAASKGDVLVLGIMQNSSWSWTAQKWIFLSTSGGLTQTVPSSGFTKIMGYAISANTMFVCPAQPVLAEDVATAEVISATAGALLYVVATETLYRYEPSGAAYSDDNTFVLSTGDGGDTRWLGVAGKYHLLDFYLYGLTATRLMASDGSKQVSSTDLSSWLDGTTDQITVTDDGDGTATLSTPQNIATGSSPEFAGLTVSGLDASKLVAAGTSKELASTDASSWISGTDGQIEITDDGDGTATIGTPQDIDEDATPTFAGLAAGDLYLGDPDAMGTWKIGLDADRNIVFSFNEGEEWADKFSWEAPIFALATENESYLLDDDQDALLDDSGEKILGDEEVVSYAIATEDGYGLRLW